MNVSHASFVDFRLKFVFLISQSKNSEILFLEYSAVSFTGHLYIEIGCPD